MGAGASAQGGDEESGPVKPIVLKGLPGAIENAIYVREKWPLIVDPTEQAGRFLRYLSGDVSALPFPRIDACDS